jgi:hypothetical protein
MAAMSAMPQEMVQNDDIVRTICSDPSFIAEIYHLITLADSLQIDRRLSELLETMKGDQYTHAMATQMELQMASLNKTDTLKEVLLRDHSTTVIGGAAFILYVYALNKKNIRNVPKTSDIDIAIWYNEMIEDTVFRERNVHMEDAIRTIFQQRTSSILAKIKSLVSKKVAIESFTIDVPESLTYYNMTTNINVIFNINGTPIKVVDIAVKNAIYSQDIPKNRTRSSIPLYYNVTHTGYQNTTLLSLFGKSVRVPALLRLYQQQWLGYINTELEINKQHANIQTVQQYANKYPDRTNYKDKITEYRNELIENQLKLRKYNDRILFLAKHLQLPPSSSLPLHPGRSIHSLSKKGGKRRTNRKNKRHTKRHTKRR